MPKLACPCGYVHDLSPIPDAGWVTVRDRDLERFVELESTPGTPPGATLALQGRLYGCPKCGRLMWRRAGASGYEVWAPAAPTTVGAVDEATVRADRLHALVEELLGGPPFLERLLAAPAGEWRAVRDLARGILDVPADLGGAGRGALLTMWSPLPGDRPGTRDRAAIVTFLRADLLWSLQVLHFGAVAARPRAPAT